MHNYEEFPRTLYRTNERGEVVGATFNSAEEVPTGEGWAPIDEFINPVPAAVEKQGRPPRYHELKDENARLLDSVKFLTDENERLQRELDALKAPEGEAETPPETPRPARKRKAQA